MSQKQNDLLGECEYPDLSEQDEQQQEQIIDKTNKKQKLQINSSINKQIHVSNNQNKQNCFIAPPTNIIGLPGKMFIPPPPPPSSRKQQNNVKSNWNQANRHSKNSQSSKSYNNPNNSNNQNIRNNSNQHSQHQNNYNESQNNYNQNQNRYGQHQNNYQNKHNQHQNNYNQNQNYYNSNINRQKKNIVYVKNIPNHFNSADKLMTFFRNQGSIKDVKVNENQHSAVVRFVKEEQAIKFLKSAKIIFNRTYITYSDNQNQTVSVDLVKEREADEQGNAKRPVELQFKFAKDRMDTVLAQRIRALYYLSANFIQSQQNADSNRQQQSTSKHNSFDQSKTSFNYNRHQITQDLQYSLKLKQNILTFNDTQFKQLQLDLINNMNWTLTFIKHSTFQYEKKNLYADYQKIGTISYAEINLISQRQSNTQPNKDSIVHNVSNEQRQKSEQVETKSNYKIYQYRLTIQYLVPKTSWQFYSGNHDKFQIQVQGAKMKQIFKSRNLKQIKRNIPVAAHDINIQVKQGQPQNIDIPPSKVHGDQSQQIREAAKQSSDDQYINKEIKKTLQVPSDQSINKEVKNNEQQQPGSNAACKKIDEQ